MNDLTKSNDFYNGVLFGLNLFQQKVINAHKRKEPLVVGDEIFYLQSGRERLEEMLNRICE